MFLGSSLFPGNSIAFKKYDFRENFVTRTDRVNAEAKSSRGKNHNTV